MRLNPTVRDEQYLRWVRELLSMKVTGSPGGYPIFLKRWTRMGHARNNLDQMLLLGEPEAVAAVVYTPGLTHDIARRAWWASPSATNARCLLENPEVVAGELGKELTAYLLEFLPFEEVQLDVVDTVRLCLQGELISPLEREKLWNRAKRKNPFYIGFLHADPAYIPLPDKPHRHHAEIAPQLATHCAQQATPTPKPSAPPLAAAGKTGYAPCNWHWKNPSTKMWSFPCSSLLAHTLHYHSRNTGGYANSAAPSNGQNNGAPEDCPPDLQAVLDTLNSDNLPLLKAMLILAQVGEDSLIPYFGGNDAVGSVMRKRLEPLTAALLAQTTLLLQ